MQFILDNLIAVAVSAALTLMLISQQTATRQDTLERQSVYAAKVQSLTFAEWLERDIVKLGARFGDDRGRFTPVADSTVDGVPFTTRFEFWYNEEENDDDTVTRTQVQYQLAVSDSSLVALATDTTPARYVKLYRLDREERTGRYYGGHWVDRDKNEVAAPNYVHDSSRQSPAGLSYFHIDPRTSDRTAISSPDAVTEADYMNVQFSVLPIHFPIYRARYIRETGLSYASTFEIRPF